MSLSEPAKPKDEGRSIPVGIGTAILLFGFILQFFSARQSLPLEIQYVSTIFIAATAFLFAVWVWFPPIARYLSARNVSGKEDRISRENLASFQSYVNGLKRNCQVQRSDSLMYPLQNMRSQSDALPDLNPWVYYVDTLCSQLVALFDRIQINRQTFVWAVDSFTMLLRLYGDNVNHFINQARSISEQNPNPIQKHFKEDYNTIRLTYVRLLDDYADFVEGLNKQFRTTIRTYPGLGGTLAPTTETAFHGVYVEKPKEL
jgi:hypothetical protein